MFFVAIAVGAVVVALMIKVLKKDVELETVPPVPNTPVEETPVKASNNTTDITNLTHLTTKQLINVDSKQSTRDDIIDAMIKDLVKDGAVTDHATFKEAIMAREKESTTGIGMEVAIPHGKSDAVKEPRIAFYISKDGVDWSSLDGTLSKLIFMIAVPKSQAGDQHLKILQLLSRKLMDDTFREKLIKAQTKDEAYRLLEEIK
jgi:PTS system fructose-specific IIC component